MRQVWNNFHATQKLSAIWLVSGISLMVSSVPVTDLELSQGMFAVGVLSLCLSVFAEIGWLLLVPDETQQEGQHNEHFRRFQKEGGRNSAC